MSMNFSTELVTIFYPCTVCWQGTGLEITSVKDKKHPCTRTQTDRTDYPFTVPQFQGCVLFDIQLPRWQPNYVSNISAT